MPGTGQCSNSRPHLPHTWMDGRETRWCPGVEPPPPPRPNPGGPRDLWLKNRDRLSRRRSRAVLVVISSGCTVPGHRSSAGPVRFIPEPLPRKAGGEGSGKPNTDAVCGMPCPQCKANPGCLKGIEHFGQTEHFCMNCRHVWGP